MTTVIVLLNTSCSDGCYLRKWILTYDNTFPCGCRRLHAANLFDSEVPPMYILGSTRVPLIFPPENKVFPMMGRVICKWPHNLLLGENFFPNRRIVTMLAPREGFQPDPSSQWILFLSDAVYPKASPLVSLKQALINPANQPPDSIAELILRIQR